MTPSLQVLTSRTGTEELDSLKKTYPETLEIVPLDIASDESVAEAAEQIEEKVGSPGLRRQ